MFDRNWPCPDLNDHISTMVRPHLTMFDRRLALARVSVLRGEGPKCGEPCIDDYVRCVDPVYDYLTRYR